MTEEEFHELRLHRARAGGERIESPRTYLSTVVSRLSLDRPRSARFRRETYVGEWLPEPLVERRRDPARKTEMACRSPSSSCPSGFFRRFLGSPKTRKPA